MKGKIIDYFIVRHHYQEVFRRFILEALENGWELRGYSSSIINENGSTEYSQDMVKCEKVVFDNLNKCINGENNE